MSALSGQTELRPDIGIESASLVEELRGVAWGSKLSEPIRLDGDRGELRTLKDAAEFLQREFRSITRNDTLQGAIEDLMRAADSGKLADRRAATEQLRLFLSSQRLLSGGSGGDIQARLRRQLRLDRRT